MKRSGRQDLPTVREIETWLAVINNIETYPPLFICNLILYLNLKKKFYQLKSLDTEASAVLQFNYRITSFNLPYNKDYLAT